MMEKLTFRQMMIIRILLIIGGMLAEDELLRGRLKDLSTHIQVHG